MKNQLRIFQHCCVLIIFVGILAGCASTPEQKVAEEQRRMAEQQTKEEREQQRWQQSLANYSDEQLSFKFAALEQAIARGTDGMNILLAAGNGIGVLIAQGQIEAKVKERDAVGLELVRRRTGIQSRPPSSAMTGNGNESAKPKASGSGFFITDNGFLLTNFHVVEGAEAVTVKHGGQSYDAKIIRRDEGADVAVLKVTGKFVPLPISDSRLVKLGEKVFTLGFPETQIQGEEPKFTEGSISSLYGMHDDSAQFQISVPLQHGNSGGPLVNAAGQVLGITCAGISKLQNVNYAVKSNRIRLVTDDVSGINLKVSEVGSPLAPEQVAERLSISTALLLIY